MLITRNRGFTLIELLVSLVLGLVVVGGVMGVFVSSYQANSQNIKAIRLNEEMRAVVALMTRDIRRAGTRGFDWTTTNVSWYSTYQFGTTGTNWVVSRYDNTAPVDSCVLFTYDINGDDTLDDGDRFGYRLNPGTGAIEAYNHVAGQWVCNGSNAAWAQVTDPEIAWIRSLAFTATTEPGVAGILVRTVVLNLRAATHTRSTDPSNLSAADCSNIDVVCRQIEETIRVRNDPVL